MTLKYFLHQQFSLLFILCFYYLFPESESKVFTILRQVFPFFFWLRKYCIRSYFIVQYATGIEHFLLFSTRPSHLQLQCHLYLFSTALFLTIFFQLLQEFQLSCFIFVSLFILLFNTLIFNVFFLSRLAFMKATYFAHKGTNSYPWERFQSKLC